ncbi:metal ABC transporter ATP-binding protein [Candidatus Uhrbacteria bacterium]|nr:metal ABC transporter ATP-binding protein [Candidatus Uhrbacteria bacterium]
MRAASAKTNNAPAICVDGLSVTYGDVAVLDDVSFDIPRGSITAIIGPNGSGKTTLLRAMLGLVPHKGTVAVFGEAIRKAHDRIGYVPQRFDFDRTFPMTVGEFLTLYRRKGGETPEHIIREVGLQKPILAKTLGTLSGGQLQRVLIAQAIINNPALLFLDEPSTGIDVAGEAALYDVLAHLNETHGTTIVLVSHDLSMLADIVDHVVAVNRRLVCVGTPERALTPKRLAELYGSRAKSLHHDHSHG